jgi:hypothetical protein
VKVHRDVRNSKPHRPRAVRRHSRGCSRSVGRGTCRPAIEPRNVLVLGADAVLFAEGNTRRGVIASASVAWRGLRTWHACTLFAREPGDLQSDHSHLTRGVARIGKARSRSR